MNVQNLFEGKIFSLSLPFNCRWLSMIIPSYGSFKYESNCCIKSIGVICLYTALFMILFSNTSTAQSAEFSSDKTSGCFPLTVNFTDGSTDSPTSWTWDFGNGNSSVLKNPSAIYTTPGTYTVKLTVSGGSTKTKIGFIVVYDNPHVDFIADVTSGCTPLSVNFTDKSNPGSGLANDWLWVFGDGGTSTARNPNHSFTSSGNKIISLRVRNQFGCESTEVRTDAIRIGGPLVDFDASSTSVCAVPATIQFTNKSAGTGSLSFVWDFGDSKSSSIQNPSHEYTKAGSYVVTLQTTDPAGCKGVASKVINAGSAGGLDFSKSASRICLGQQVSFTLQSIKNVTNVNWDFGNITTSTETNPSIVYSKPGVYQVTLTARLDGNTCNSVITHSIEVLDSPAPQFSFTVNCSLNAKFSNTSTNSTKWVWEFGTIGSSTSKSPEFLFWGPGNYLVKLTAYNESGCSKSIAKSVATPEQPIANFLPALEQDCIQPSLSGCAPFTVPFVNTSQSTAAFTTLWTFGDGTTSTDKDKSHTYTKAGSYTISLKVINTFGCSSSASKKVTVSNTTPVAKFIISKTTVCALEDVLFTDQSTDANFWCWDFGDGEKGIGKTILHKYKKSGKYTVTLIAKNAGCSNTSQRANVIEVASPDVDFTVVKTCSNPFVVTLQNKSTQFHSLLWDFGDGQTSAVDVTAHTYISTGSYTISLEATNNDTHCKVKLLAPVVIRNLSADFQIDNNKPCRNAPVTFKDKSNFAVAWHWDFGNSKVSELQNDVTAYAAAGSYGITLTSFDADGCSKQKTLSVNVLNLEGNFVSQLTHKSCSDLTMQFTNLSSGTPAITNWQWDFGDGQTSIAKNPTNVYKNVGSYPVKLTLTNSEGNCSFLVPNAVVFTIPQPAFSINRPGHCLKDKITIINSSQYASSFEWNFGDGRTSIATNPQIAYDKTGEYDVTLTAKDNGCSVELKRLSFIAITKPTAAFKVDQTSSPCPPLLSKFSPKPQGNIQLYSWNFGDGQKSVLSDSVVYNMYMYPGSYDVTLIVTDNNLCSDTTTIAKLVNIGGPHGDFSINGQQLLCTNDTVNFNSQTKNAMMYQWDFGDGHVETLASANPNINARHLYQRAGPYKVALVLTDENGCKVSARGDVQITIATPTTIGFSYPPCLFEKDVLTLQTQSSQDDLSFVWEIDGTTAGQDPALTTPVDTPGDREVVLHTTNAKGCRSDTTQIISVNGYIEKIPNVFTPNDTDDLNSHFQILGIEHSEWNLTVYNRWGGPVYKKARYSNDWNGDDLPPGVYYYALQNNFCPDKIYKGLVSILR